jgi:hypothetical protein
MRATCNHKPRRLVPNGAKNKNGTSVMVCADCRVLWRRKYYRKKQGFGALWDSQGGLCAFCNQPLVDDNTTNKDHDHVTGRVRGLVHAQCNQMIAGLEHTLRLVGWERARRYLGD